MPHFSRTDAGQEPFERTKQDVKDVIVDRRAIRMVRNFMERSAKYREPHLELARQSREMYENWQPTSRSLVQRANLKLPFGFTIIETQLPQLMDIFWRSGNVIKFKGQDPTDSDWEDSITDFHTHQLEEMDFQAKTAFFKKSMLLDGTAFAKVPYRFKELNTVRRRSQVDSLTGQSTQVKENVLEVQFDGPDLEVIPIYDFFPDWSVKIPGNVEAMRGCVHRTFSTINSLKQIKKYKNIGELQHSMSVKGSSAWKGAYYDRDNFKRDFEYLQDNRHFGIKDKGQVEVWEYWGLYDPKQDGNFEEYIITVANGDVVIGLEKNFYDYKFKPFVACPNFLRENEFYGIPELLAVRSLIKEANTLRNARLDNINLSVNPMWLADRASGINAKSLYSRPNGIIWTNDINGIKPLPPHDPSIGSQNEMTLIQQDIQNATALVNAAPTLSQLGKQFGRSATGVNFIQSFSSSRIGLKARILADMFYKKVAWIMLMTNRQFVDEDKWVRVSDPNTPNPFIQLPPDAFFRKFDFVVQTMMENGGPEAQFQKMQSVAQIAQVFENSQPGTFKTQELLESLMRPLVGRDTKRFIRTDEEREELQNRQLAAQQAINAQQGQAAPQPNAQGPAAAQSGAQQALATLGLGE